MTVELKDGREFEGRVYGIDTLTDLAIVKIEGAEPFPTAPIGDSGELKVGQLASRSAARSAPTRTASRAASCRPPAARSRSRTAPDRQPDPDRRGDQPRQQRRTAVDAAGNVIGINTAVATDSNGIGFAIPINIARPIMQQAVAGQELARPFIGIRYVQVNAQAAKDQDLPVHAGRGSGRLATTGSRAGERGRADGPAAQAGIRNGDIVTHRRPADRPRAPAERRPDPVRAGSDGQRPAAP